MNPLTDDTLSGAIDQLHEAGYVEDFNLRPHCLFCASKRIEIEPDAFAVDAVYRHEGMTDPDDQSILYAISSKKYGLKGVLVNAYGIYADPVTAEMEQKLAIH